MTATLTVVGTKFEIAIYDNDKNKVETYICDRVEWGGERDE